MIMLCVSRFFAFDSIFCLWFALCIRVVPCRDVVDWSMTPDGCTLVLLVFPYMRQGAWFEGVFAIHGLMLLRTVRSLDFVCIVRSRDFPKCVSVCFGQSSRGWFHGMSSLCFLYFGGSSSRALGLGFVFVSCERRSYTRFAPSRLSLSGVR